MKRKIALLLVVVMILGTLSSLTFAEKMGAKEGEFLKDKGILIGDQSGDLMLDKHLKRQDAVVLLSRLMNVEEEAKKFDTEGLTFEDIGNDYYKSFISWAVHNGYFIGHDVKNFGFGEDITVCQYSAVLLRVLGYKDVKYDDTFIKANELGLYEGVDVADTDKILRNNMAIITLNTLKTNLKDEAKTLAEKLEIVIPIEFLKVDKTELVIAIKEAELLNSNNYTIKTWNVLKEALYGAKTINEKKDATILEINNALKVLKDAIKALVKESFSSYEPPVEEPKKANLSAYYRALEAVHEEDYTEESWAIYQEVVLDNVVTENNTQKRVDEATAAIIAAQKFLARNIVSFGNEFEIGTFNEFLSGEMNNIELVDYIGDGAIILSEIDGEFPLHGYYISQVIDVPDFEYMVMSWNSDTPEGTYVEVQARVLVNHFDENNEPIQTWTDWLSWGKWSPHIARASATRRDALARTSVDELIINGSKGETASKVQLKVNLHTEDPLVTPVIRYLHGTLKNSMIPIAKEYNEEIDVTNLDKDIPTPEYSQMIRNPRTKSSICSPTTITMMMNRFGEELLPDEVAQNTYDSKYGFGNWAFAMASAGSYGYKSYLDYTTIEGLKREIYKGYPVGVSVRYTNDPNDTRYPYIEGAPGATPGHLIVVRGFATIDGVEYVIVNDSYAPGDDTVRRLYKLEQFDKAWSNRAAYIIHDKERNAGTAPTMRIDANLEVTDTPDEYAVFVNNKNIDVTNWGGVIAYTLDNDLTYGYFDKANKNSLTFTREQITNPDLKVYVITDTGKVYVARFTGELPIIVDKTSLNDLIVEVEGLLEEDYTEESWTVLQAKMLLAIDIRDNPDATQDEVNLAVAELLEAIEALVRIEVEDIL